MFEILQFCENMYSLNNNVSLLLDININCSNNKKYVIFLNQCSLPFPVSGGPVVLLLSDVQGELREVQHLPGLQLHLPTYPEGGGRESLHCHHCVSLTMSMFPQ